ncbi:hypothetical protein CYG49_01920 [Candidatus Saccharibacteria bacterium]|nr:MAG: hypothetical protein CYG49_01920 [Candidatus Saccharibacteria bacterium]
MKSLKRLRNHTLKLASKARYTAVRPKQRRFIHKDVPYFCQWESRELAEQFLTGELGAESDPKWKESGASSPKEYALWSWNGCGMACLKSILASTGRNVTPLAVLAKKCTDYDGYVVQGSQVDGLYYKPFVQFMKQEFGISAVTKPVMTVEDIVLALSQGKFVIASVSPDIRHPESQPLYKGGHLVLVLGYDLDKKFFLLHNPSGFTVKSQGYAEVSFEQFKNFFDEKGIVVQG